MTKQFVIVNCMLHQIATSIFSGYAFPKSNRAYPLEVYISYSKVLLSWPSYMPAMMSIARLFTASEGSYTIYASANSRSIGTDYSRFLIRYTILCLKSDESITWCALCWLYSGIYFSQSALDYYWLVRIWPADHTNFSNWSKCLQRFFR